LVLFFKKNRRQRFFLKKEAKTFLLIGCLPSRQVEVLIGRPALNFALMAQSPWSVTPDACSARRGLRARPPFIRHKSAAGSAFFAYPEELAARARGTSSIPELKSGGFPGPNACLPSGTPIAVLRSWGSTHFERAQMTNSQVHSGPHNGTPFGSIAGAPPITLAARKTEQSAFENVTSGIVDADTTAKRIRALGHNHNLWSALVKDLAQDSNTLPASVKSELISLGMWSMRYSTLAILHDLPLQPLIGVNRNISDGLAQQNAAMAA
jgi:flagellar biosynthesis regulator FlaF